MLRKTYSFGVWWLQLCGTYGCFNYVGLITLVGCHRSMLGLSLPLSWDFSCLRHGTYAFSYVAAKKQVVAACCHSGLFSLLGPVDVPAP